MGQGWGKKLIQWQSFCVSLNLTVWKWSKSYKTGSGNCWHCLVNKDDFLQICWIVMRYHTVEEMQRYLQSTAYLLNS